MGYTETPQFLVLTPHTEEYRNLSKLITSSLEEIGFKPILLEESVLPGEPFVTSIHKAIETADVVIADITGSNPNIMYETGYASALGKPVLPIVRQNVGRVPSEIGNQFYLVYDLSKPDELREGIKTWVPRYLKYER